MAIKWFLSKNKNKKIVVVVPTDHLKIQWIKTLSRNRLINNVSVEIINSSIKINDKIDFLVLDECHRIPSDTFFTIFKERKPSIVLGLSATFSRLDGKHELLNKYCPVCDVITIKEAIDNNWLSKYIEYKVLLKPKDIEEYKIINKQFFSTFSFFGHDFNLAMNCVGGIKKGNKVIVPSHKVRYNYAVKLCTVPSYQSNYYETVKSINSEVTAMAFSWNKALQDRKSYITNHPLKVEVARKILNARPFAKAITFSATIKQADKIGIGASIHSGKTKKRNRITIEEFVPLSCGVINSSKSLDEGVDIPGLNLAVILCNFSSTTQKIQRVGRIIRFEEGKKAEIFTLVIAETVEEGWYNSSTDGNSYVEINEDELDAILDGVELEKLEKVAKQPDILFRL